MRIYTTMRHTAWTGLVIIAAILAGVSITTQFAQVVRGGIATLANDLSETLYPKPLANQHNAALSVRQLQMLWHALASQQPNIDDRQEMDERLLGANFRWVSCKYKILSINEGNYYKTKTTLRQALRLRGAIDDARVLLTEAQRTMLEAPASAH